MNLKKSILSRVFHFSVALAVIALTMASFAGTASAAPPNGDKNQGTYKSSCSAFPQVAWWGELTHERVVKYVKRKHNGNWKPYLAKWEKQKSRLTDIYKRNGTVVIKKFNIKLKGQPLANYIQTVGKRISVTKCLSLEAGMGKGK
ncbi:MAG TPA: hypothetical protein ENI72_01955 [Rhodospirillales bacterium]|nr:hypothetical protein [Rhodospirillales bacterium]